MKSLVGVRGAFSATHRDPVRREYHGHSFEVVAWFRKGDAVELQGRLRTVLGAYDHVTLPDRVTRSEAIGRQIIRALPGCVGVEVNRPVEGISVKVGRTA